MSRPASTGVGGVHADPDSRANQVIRFTEFPTDKMVGDPAFAIGAVVSSGLPVSFKGLTPAVCTVQGHTVTLVAKATGTCSIRAHVRRTSHYRAASATRSLTVSPAAPSGGTVGGSGDPPGNGVATPELLSGILLGLSGLPLLLVLAWRRRR